MCEDDRLLANITGREHESNRDFIGQQVEGVAHGMAPLTAGERYVLGCPFHDYWGAETSEKR